MEFKKIAKCTGKILAKTALVTGGVAVDIGTQLPGAMLAKAAGERPKAHLRSNCVSKWLYEKAGEIKVSEEQDSEEKNTDEKTAE